MSDLAPPCRPKPSLPPPRCARIRVWLRSSAPSVRSRPSISTSARSSVGPPAASAPTSSSACSPITSNGPRVRPSPPCCSTTTTTTASRPNAPCRGQGPHVGGRQAQGHDRSSTTTCPSTAFDRSSPSVATLTRNTVRLGRDYAIEIPATDGDPAPSNCSLSSPHRSHSPRKRPGKTNHLHQIRGKVRASGGAPRAEGGGR